MPVVAKELWQSCRLNFRIRGESKKKKKTYSAASRTSHLPTPVDYHVNYTVCIYTIMIYKRSVLPRSGESFFFSIPFRLCSNVFSSLTHTHIHPPYNCKSSTFFKYWDCCTYRRCYIYVYVLCNYMYAPSVSKVPLPLWYGLPCCLSVETWGRSKRFLCFQ